MPVGNVAAIIAARRTRRNSKGLVPTPVSHFASRRSCVLKRSIYKQLPKTKDWLKQSKGGKDVDARILEIGWTRCFAILLIRMISNRQGAACSVFAQGFCGRTKAQRSCAGRVCQEGVEVLFSLMHIFQNFQNLLLHLCLGRWNWEISSGTAEDIVGMGCLNISKWRASDLLQGYLENLNSVGLNWQGLWYEQVWQTGVCNLPFSVSNAANILVSIWISLIGRLKQSTAASHEILGPYLLESKIRKYHFFQSPPLFCFVLNFQAWSSGQTADRHRLFNAAWNVAKWLVDKWNAG